MNNEKIILDLCGGTGSWSRPYKEAGYDAEVITLPKYDVTRVDFDGRWRHLMHFARQDVPWDNYMTVDCRDVYGVLAAPPCTEFSVAKGSKPRDLQAGIGIVEACLRIIWHCRLHGKPKFWAIENPRGLLRQFLGMPAFTFQQWEFGDMQIKPTDVWGYFSVPRKIVHEKPEQLTVRFGSRTNGRGWAKPKCPDEFKHLNLDRAALRAITPPGFAKAFFKANK